MTYPLMQALVWLCLAYIFVDLGYQAWLAWRDRPMVMWDDEQLRWRSVRIIQRERGHASERTD